MKAWLVDWGHEEVHEEIKNLYAQTLTGKSWIGMAINGTNGYLIRYWLDGRVKAHIFICYLSYLLMKTLEHMLKKGGLNKNEDTIFRSGERSYRLLHIDRDKKKQVLARLRSATGAGAGYRKLTRVSIQSEGNRLLSHAHISFPQEARKLFEDISER